MLKLTTSQHHTLQAELERRLTRREILQDRMENVIQKDMRMNEQLDREAYSFAQNEKRIKRIQSILEDSQVQQPQGELLLVTINAVVHLQIDHRTEEIQILPADSPAVNPLAGMISAKSKLGAALLGRKSGEKFTIEIAGRARHYHITKILG